MTPAAPDRARRPRTVGVLVNPVAGYGALLAMHGTGALDDEQYSAALAGGRAMARMRRALDRALGRLSTPPRLVAGPGLLGSDLLTEMGLEHEVAGRPVARTTARDTIDGARRLCDRGIDCLAFAGGDGTATDLAGQIGPTPVVGVPAGVKMHSGVFARSPEAAGDLLVAVVEDRVRVERCDLLDVVDGMTPRVTGAMWVPAVRQLLQGPKSSASRHDPELLAALGRQLLATADPGARWILGPGTTVAETAHGMGMDSTVRGFDVVDASGPDVLDATEEQLITAARTSGTHVLLGVVGGQGFLLGRGNHELSARVLAHLDPDRIHVVASADKLATLVPPVLHVDLGDADPVPGLDGYRAVHVGPGRTTMMRIVSSAADALPALP